MFDFRDNWFTLRRTLWPDIQSTTVTHDSMGGRRFLIYSPSWREELEGSLLKVWRQLRDMPVSQKEAFYILLTLHPWCWEEWGTVAQDIIQGRDPHGDSFYDVIQEAQTDLLQELRDGDELWDAAVARSIEAFPGWIIKTMRNRCRNVWDRYGRHMSGTKRHRREHFSEEISDRRTDQTDVVGAAIAKEFWAKVDSVCAPSEREILKRLALSFTYREIAAALNFSKDHVARAIAKELARLGIHLKDFL